MTSRVGVGVLILAMLQLGSAANNPEPMDGYSPAHAATERDWETKFRSIPDTSILRDSMQHLSAWPHNVGSPYDKANAEWMLAKFEDYGFDAHIETFDVLFPTPKERSVELLAPKHFVAKLQEPPLSIDPTSQQTAQQLPTYNAYSIDGDVTGPRRPGTDERGQPGGLHRAGIGAGGGTAASVASGGKAFNT